MSQPTTDDRPPVPGSAPDILAWARDLVQPALRDAVARLDETNRAITAYHFGWTDLTGNPTVGGGKGLRPALAPLSARAAGSNPRVGVPGAVAVELVHNFSLLHDDVIDRGTERRHRPSVWAVWGTAVTYALTHGGADGREVAAWLAGGRWWATEEAGRRLALAEQALRGVALDAVVRHELLHLAHFAVARET